MSCQRNILDAIYDIPVGHLTPVNELLNSTLFTRGRSALMMLQSGETWLFYGADTDFDQIRLDLISLSRTLRQLDSDNTIVLLRRMKDPLVDWVFMQHVTTFQYNQSSGNWTLGNAITLHKTKSGYTISCPGFEDMVAEPLDDDSIALIREMLCYSISPTEQYDEFYRRDYMPTTLYALRQSRIANIIAMAGVFVAVFLTPMLMHCCVHTTIAPDQIDYIINAVNHHDTSTNVLSHQ